MYFRNGHSFASLSLQRHLLLVAECGDLMMISIQITQEVTHTMLMSAIRHTLALGEYLRRGVLIDKGKLSFDDLSLYLSKNQ
jgi:hypothetical protein